MLFKMLGIERAYGQQCSDSSSVPKPRQLFVTQSRVLASRVEEYFSKLLDSLAVAKKTNQEIRDLAEKKRLLQDNTTPLYHPDDDVSWQALLPQKFSLLQDEHFPLFLTFERVRVYQIVSCTSDLTGTTKKSSYSFWKTTSTLFNPTALFVTSLMQEARVRVSSWDIMSSWRSIGRTSQTT